MCPWAHLWALDFVIVVYLFGLVWLGMDLGLGGLKLVLFMCTCVCLHMHVNVCWGACGDQKRASDLLELKL